MATLLIERLEECCRLDRTLEPLLAQWLFDQRLCAKALQNIGRLFPHYSRHDESHSIQILTNIERVLGSARIKKLSATNVWLLLEAAYLHDIGMIVGHAQQREDWNSQEFVKFAQDNIQGASVGDAELLKSIIRGEKQFSIFTTKDHPLNQIAKIQQLLAEFYRRKHADRAAAIAMQPLDSIGLSSPRNELIPRRLFGMLGEVCRLHGKGNAEVMTLPYAASGLGRDEIHPRFIACMLRLGDLLDLDDNRFCPVMLETAGELPSSTHAHIDKHHSIKHLRVDVTRIEVIARCATYEGYVETENWFAYLRQEVAWQMAHWADIVPEAEFGLLPTVGEIKTELAGFELIDNSRRPQFELDDRRVMELLQGAGLYKSASDSVRELMQNAIDATLIHVWLMHGEGEGENGSSFNKKRILLSDNPYDQNVREILSAYPIRIKIEFLPAETGDDEPKVTIEISDMGVGIARSDIPAMAKVGGSYRSTWKQDVVDRMPLWMRPSGGFGIGLQSAFLLTDEVTYLSKSVLDGSELSLRMASPTGIERGAIYIQKVQVVDVARSPGTTVKFSLAKGVYIQLTSQQQEYRDPMGPPSLTSFRQIAQNTPLPVQVNGNLVVQKVSQDEDWVYLAEFGMAVALRLSTDRPMVKVYFKGQRVHGDGIQLCGCPFKIFINIFGDADTTVSIDRSRLRYGMRDRVRQAVSRAMMIKYKDSLGEKERAYLSAWLLLHDSPVSNEYMACRWRNDQRGGGANLIFGSRTGVSLKDFLSTELYLASRCDFELEMYVYKNKFYHDHDGFCVFISRAFQELGFRGEIVTPVEAGVDIPLGLSDEPILLTRFSKNGPPWTNLALKSLLFENLEEGLRVAIPVDDRFAYLASLSWDSDLTASAAATYCPGRNYFYSPFVVKDNELEVAHFDQLVEWTFSNRINKSIKIEDIRKAYEEFIDFVDGIMEPPDMQDSASD